LVRRLLPLIPVALAGCALTPPGFQPARPVTVETPVVEAVYCAPPALTYPRLPIAGLSIGSKPADTIRAFAASITILKGVVRERDELIAGCAQASHGARETASGVGAQ
jgi:hypothetical protein